MDSKEPLVIYFGGVKTITSAFRDDLIKMHGAGVKNILGTFWTPAEVKGLMQLSSQKQKFNLFLDSGAFSLWRLAEKKGIKNFYGTPMLEEYLKKYERFLLQSKDKFVVYVTLDIVFDQEATFAIWKQMYEKGINSLPVLHIGEPVEALDKYFEATEDVSYIGLGGVGRSGVTDRYYRWADSVFVYLSKLKKKVKVHGFAMTAPKMIMRYPWDSVDSVTPLVNAYLGNILYIKESGDMLGLYVSERLKKSSVEEAEFELENYERMDQQKSSKNDISKEEEEFWRSICQERDIDYDNMDWHNRVKFNLISYVQFQNNLSSRGKNLFQKMIKF